MDGVLDHAPVAQIEASLGGSAAILFASPSTVFVTEGATQSGQVSCHGLDDRADRGVEGEAQPRAHHYSK